MDGRDSDICIKSIFREEILSRKPRWMEVEIIQKAFIYNLLLNAA
ncbi:MAG: hypothetical protein QXN23_01735 [Candidatus Caldarchaeum sp.]